MNIKHILVATDCSEGSLLALQRGMDLAGLLGVDITVLHALERSSADLRGAGAPGGRKIPMAERIEEAERTLRKEVHKAIGETNVQSAVKATIGKPFVEIIQVARSVKADLIVLGAHGKHFFKDPFIGSTAERVVRNGDRSVLVVKQPVTSSYRRVIVGVDFSDVSRQALATALELAPESEIQVLNAYQYLTPEEEKRRLAPFTSSEDYLRQIRELAIKDMAGLLRKFDLGSRHLGSLVKFGYPPSILRNQVRKHKPDLVAVGAMGKSNLRYMLLGSTASHALTELKCDVLVVRTGPSLPFELP